MKPFAIVTGASSGLGYELAAICAREGYDLLIAADHDVTNAASLLRAEGAAVEALQVDLSTTDGIARLMTAVGGRPVDVLIANAGHGLDGHFIEQDFDKVRHVIDTNVAGTVDLVQQVARPMVAKGEGRILITSSIAGYVPGTFHAVYAASKAFVDSFCFALRAELKDSGVSVTCLIPGETETEFSERTHILDTQVRQAGRNDPADVARTGFDAMMKGQAAGWSPALAPA